MKLTPRSLLKDVAAKDEPVARGFGKLIIYYRLTNRDEDAKLVEALFELYQRQFQQHKHTSFSEFDQRIQRQKFSNENPQEVCTMGILSNNIDFKVEEQAIRNQVIEGIRCADCLKIFNLGERKYFKARSNIIICQQCYATESSACEGGSQ